MTSNEGIELAACTFVLAISFNFDKWRSDEPPTRKFKTTGEALIARFWPPKASDLIILLAFAFEIRFWLQHPNQDVRFSNIPGICYWTMAFGCFLRNWAGE